MSDAHAIAVPRRRRRRRRPPSPGEVWAILWLMWGVVWGTYSVINVALDGSLVYGLSSMLHAVCIAFWWPRAWPPLKRWIIGEED